MTGCQAPFSPLVSVVIPTFRRSDRCERLIEALSRQSLDSHLFEVIVVDDCSEDGTLERLEQLPERCPFELRVLKTTANSGQATARNVGAAAAKAPYLAFTDDDCVPRGKWLEEGLAALHRSASIGVAQGRTTAPSNQIREQRPWRHEQDISSLTPWFESCNIFYRADAFRQAGGFDEAIRWWGEDTSLGWAVVDNGWEQAFADNAVIEHDIQYRGWWWWMRAGFAEKNLIYVAKRHPNLRRSAFWKPWAVRIDDAAFVLAFVSVLATKRWRLAAVGSLPYIMLTRQSIRSRRFLFATLGRTSVDMARCAGHLVGSTRERILVL